MQARRQVLPCGMRALPLLLQTAGQQQHAVRARALTSRSTASLAGAAVGAQQHTQQEQQRQREAWQSCAPALLGLAAAAAWHAAPKALADADRSWQAVAQAAAQAAADEAFQQALLDHHRALATAAPGGSSSVAPQQPQQPRVTLQNGTHVAVSVPLLPGADVGALLRAIEAGMDELASNSTSCSQQQSSYLLSTQRVLLYDVDRCLERQQQQQQRHSGGGGARQQLSVQVVLPLQESSPHEASSDSSNSSSSSSHGQVTVVKAGPFTADELALLSKLVAAANTPGSARGASLRSWSASPETADPLGLWGLGGPDSDSDSSSDPFRALQGLGGAVLGGLFGELLQELQSGLQDMQQQQGWEGSAPPDDPQQRRSLQDRLDSFFGSLGDRLGGKGAGAASQLPADVEAQVQQLEQQLQAQLQALAPPDVLEWLRRLTDQQEQGGEQQPGEQQQVQWRPRGSRAGGTPGPDPSSSSVGPSERQQQQEQEPPPAPLLPWEQPAAQAAVRQLQQLGAAVYMPKPPATAPGSSAESSSATTGQDAAAEDQPWGVIAGYEAQKMALEDCLLLPLKHPEVYAAVSARTRRTAKAGGARPRAVLFEGPPGCAKTSTARVLAGRASLPLVYVPLEAIASKWYGESEQNFAKIFKACEALGGALLFLDELDSLATSRDQGDMHEASRRLLGVLLREIDGFNHRDGSSSSSDGGGGDGRQRSVVIGATNRRQDLDAALLSRFDLTIHFGLPDEACRGAIIEQYAHHLAPADRAALASATAGLSGRDLRDVCEQTERTWASKIIRGQVPSLEEQLPALPDYLAAVQVRRQGAGRGAAVAAVSGPGGMRQPWAPGNAGGGAAA